MITRAVAATEWLPQCCAAGPCPTPHRAFDRHLFWMDADHRMRLASNFGEFSGGTTAAPPAGVVAGAGKSGAAAQ